MHVAKRRQRVLGSGGSDKAVVMGLIERQRGERASRVHARHVKDVTIRHLQGTVREVVEPGARLLTDSAAAYRGLGREYVHEVVNHAVEYVRGTVHTNGLENFWSLLKRSVKGTYVSVEPAHLGRYVDEQVFRFNERKDNDLGRFKQALGSVAGKRLTYRELTNHVLSTATA